MRPDERALGRAQRLRVVLDDLGLALPDEDVRAPIGAHVERLVACIQDEDLMHVTRAYQREVRANDLRRPVRGAS